MFFCFLIFKSALRVQPRQTGFRQLSNVVFEVTFYGTIDGFQDGGAVFIFLLLQKFQCVFLREIVAEERADAYKKYKEDRKAIEREIQGLVIEGMAEGEAKEREIGRASCRERVLRLV